MEESNQNLQINKNLGPAVMLITELFKGKKRDDGVSLQTDHCLETYNILKDYTDDTEILIATILHDCIEDSFLTYDDIADKFGVKVAEIVASVSHDNRLPKNQRDEEYIARIYESSVEAQMVKLADMIHNLKSAKTNLSDEYFQKLKQYYKRFSFSSEVMDIPLYKELTKINGK